MISIKEMNRWFCWNAREKNGRMTKIPCAPNGGVTGTNEKYAHTWMTFDEATAAMRLHGYTGVGFVIPEGMFFLDKDHVAPDDPVVKEFLVQFPTYAEQSFSGQGLHIYGFCDLSRLPVKDGKLNKRYYTKNPHNGLEVYIGGLTNRFAAFTGDVVQDLPLADCTEALLALMEKQMLRKEWVSAPAPVTMNKTMTVETEMNNELIRQAYDCYLRIGTPSDGLTTDTNVTGGYLLPADFEAKLLDAVSNTGVLRGLCTEIATERDTFLPIVTGYGKPAWVTEGGALPLVRDQFDRVSLVPHTLAATIRVTRELLKDSAVDIEKYLADTFAQRLTEAEEEAFVTGDGVNKPTGLIQQAADGCETQTAGTITLDDVLNLIFSVPEKYRRNGVLLMNDATLLHLYRLCAAQATNLWFDKTNDGKDDAFFGIRIARCAAMPDMESGKVPILFGDFRQAFISDCGKRSMKRLKELFALNDHIGFVIGERVDIRLIAKDAIKGLKVA